MIFFAFWLIILPLMGVVQPHEQPLIEIKLCREHAGISYPYPSGFT